MEPIIVAIALICGAETCKSYVQEPRFADLDQCEAFLVRERQLERLTGHMVVLDDCITTTEQRIKANQ